MDLMQILMNPESYVLLAAGASARPVVRWLGYLTVFFIFFEKLTSFGKFTVKICKKANEYRKRLTHVPEL